jgi:hypothetical protein
MPNFFRHKIFIAGLTVFVILLLGLGFSIVGTPISQKDIRTDASRLSDFYDIKSNVTNFYTDKGSLPKSLTELKTEGRTSSRYGYTIKDWVDPETKKEYEYTILTSKTFKLCTTFSTDLDKVRQQGTSTYDSYYYRDGGGTVTHKKGYDCIEYSADFYSTKPLSTPTVSASDLEKMKFASKCEGGKIVNGRCEMNSCSYTVPQDLYTKGETKVSLKPFGTPNPQVTPSESIYTDKCTSSTTLTKYSCTDNADDTKSDSLATSIYTCPNGCSLGACIK